MTTNTEYLSMFTRHANSQSFISALNVAMLCAINTADHTADTWKSPEQPETVEDATSQLHTFLDTVDHHLRYRWYNASYFLAIPTWLRTILKPYHSIIDNIPQVVIPGWDNPATPFMGRHPDTWHIVGFQTELEPIETLAYTSWNQAAAFPCSTQILEPFGLTTDDTDQPEQQ